MLTPTLVTDGITVRCISGNTYLHSYIVIGLPNFPISTLFFSLSFTLSQVLDILQLSLKMRKVLLSVILIVMAMGQIRTMKRLQAICQEGC